MERCNMILRTLGAILMALTLVLIPLSQAEALDTVPCPSGLDPGESTSGCDWSYAGICSHWVTTEWDPFFGLQKVHHYLHEDVTVTRPTWAPECLESNRSCSSWCYFYEYE